MIAAELAADVFDASYVELRVPSGALANLYGFIATCSPGDSIITPPPAIGGHVTHHPRRGGAVPPRHRARADLPPWLHG